MVDHSTYSEAETQAVARTLAQQLAAGELVFLQGPLGAGKTTFVRGVVEAFGIDPREVASPTYALLNVYPFAQSQRGMTQVAHVDLYRVESPHELYDLDLDVHAGRGPILVEWPERARGFLGEPDYTVSIAAPASAGDSSARRLSIDDGKDAS